MFRYSWYNRLRWISLAVLVIAGFFLLAASIKGTSELSGQAWLKWRLTLTHFHVGESVLTPFLVLLVGLVMGYFACVSTGLFFLYLACWEPLPAFCLGVVTQVLLSWWFWNRPIRPLVPEEKKEGQGQEVVLLENPGKVLFSLYLMLSVPLHGAEALVRAHCPPGRNQRADFFVALPGLLLRLSLEFLWSFSLLAILVDFRPFPGRDMAVFLGATGGLMFSILWLHIPELIPGGEEAGRVAAWLRGEKKAAAPVTEPPLASANGPVAKAV